jgi:hypothetical protein
VGSGIGWASDEGAWQWQAFRFVLIAHGALAAVALVAVVLRRAAIARPALIGLLASLSLLLALAVTGNHGWFTQLATSMFFLELVAAVTSLYTMAERGWRGHQTRA